MWEPVQRSGLTGLSPSPPFGVCRNDFLLAHIYGIRQAKFDGSSMLPDHAFDAATGKLLREFPLSSGVEAPPTSFSINGKQYIVLAGWGQDAGGEVNTMARLFPGEVPPMPDGGSVWVFAPE